MPKSKPSGKKPKHREKLLPILTADVAQDLSDAIEAAYYDLDRVHFPRQLLGKRKYLSRYLSLYRQFSKVCCDLFDISGELHDLAGDLEEEETHDADPW